MTNMLQSSCDDILTRVTLGPSAVPGVVAMVTDREQNIYQGAAGHRQFGEMEPMTLDSVFCIFSCTKAITATAVLQLVEQGRIDLDAPAKTYAAEIGKRQVIEGFAADGAPILRPPKRDITTRMLMLHTAGFGYDTFNATYFRLTEEQRLASGNTSSRAAINAPLLFDPGEKWEYGFNMDWAGQVVEGVTGKRLDQVMREEIFEPLGMSDSEFILRPDMLNRLAKIHQREADGTPTPRPDLVLPQEPEVFMGGHGLYATVGDFIRFIRMVLNDGQGAQGRVLRPETVAMMEQNGLGPLKVGGLSGVIPTRSNDVEFFPGLSKSWGYSFMINDEEAPTGRPAGSLGWAGLANLFYWIDRRNGLGGFWATQILPFGDPTSFEGYMDFETTAYRIIASARAA